MARKSGAVAASSRLCLFDLARQLGHHQFKRTTQISEGYPASTAALHLRHSRLRRRSVSQSLDVRRFDGQELPAV